MPKKIAFVVNHVAFFVSHRLPIAVEAKARGYDVRLFTGQPGNDQVEKLAEHKLADAGIAHERVQFRSSGLNPIIEGFAFLQLLWCLFRYRPDIVHCASPKGILFGGVAARLCRTSGLVLAVSGLGYLYTKPKETFFHKCLRFVFESISLIGFRHPNICVIVQNETDRKLLLDRSLAREANLILIPGSGVDLTQFDNLTHAEKKKQVLLPARMLTDKGVEEFVEAARKIRSIRQDWLFILAGESKYDNPTAIAEEQLKEWQTQGVIKWRGYVEDMVPLYREASIVCLPSYREGMPKALLEAAAAKCAVVTTDVPGCREAIEPGVTGDLVPPRNGKVLGEKLLGLINDPDRLHRYGDMGRERASRLYSIKTVLDEITTVYEGMSKDETFEKAAHSPGIK